MKEVRYTSLKKSFPAEADELRHIVRNEGYGAGSVTEL